MEANAAATAIVAQCGDAEWFDRAWRKLGQSEAKEFVDALAEILDMLGLAEFVDEPDS